MEYGKEITDEFMQLVFCLVVLIRSLCACQKAALYQDHSIPCPATLYPAMSLAAEFIRGVFVTHSWALVCCLFCLSGTCQGFSFKRNPATRVTQPMLSSFISLHSLPVDNKNSCLFCSRGHQRSLLCFRGFQSLAHLSSGPVLRNALIFDL